MYVSFPLRITTYFSVTIMLYNVLRVFVLFLVLCLLFLHIFKNYHLHSIISQYCICETEYFRVLVLLSTQTVELLV